MRIKKLFLRFLGNHFVVPLVNVLCKSLKINEFNKTQIEELLDEDQNIVFAFWHGTMLVPWFLLRVYSPFAIISQSKDGDILAKLLKKWNYITKRGSSSRGGKDVLEDLVNEANNNNSIAITPDGPRGPKKVMKAGGVIIAKKAQIPLVLIGISYNKKIKLNSWDRFQIPFFFSRVSVVYSEPIYFDRQLSYEETDLKIKETGDYLNEVQKKAETKC